MEALLPRGSFKRNRIEYKKDGEADRETMVARSRELKPLSHQTWVVLDQLMGPGVWVNIMISAYLMPALIKNDPTIKPTGKELLLQFLALTVVGDFGLYWGHRIQHEFTSLWEKYHSIHHSVESPSPMSTGHIHSVDTTLQVGLPGLVAAILVQPHPLSYYLYSCTQTCEHVMNHSGLDDNLIDLLTLKFLPLRGNIAHHDYHHKFCGYAGRAKNFGETFWVWDWLFGTLAVTSKVRK